MHLVVCVVSCRVDAYGGSTSLEVMALEHSNNHGVILFHPRVSHTGDSRYIPQFYSPATATLEYLGHGYPRESGLPHSSVPLCLLSHSQAATVPDILEQYASLLTIKHSETRTTKPHCE